MIQDIFPKVLNNHYVPEAQPEADDSVLIFDKTKVLANTDAGLHFPTVKELFPEGVNGTNVINGTNATNAINANGNSGQTKSGLVFLFTIDSERYFIYFTDSSIETRPQTASNGITSQPDEFMRQIPPKYIFLDLRTLRESSTEPKHRLFAALTGKHLADWYRDSRFCGRCGHESEFSKTERAKVCPICGNTVYPRIMPAVIVGVINGDKLLLTKYRSGYGHNAMVAGFTEMGETLEETVAREVMEETGVKVKNIRYYKSQPWGIANDILAGFYCELDGDDTIRMDGNELKYAEWVSRQDIELQPDDSSLTNEMMKMFKEGKE